jgi:membrane-associated phospholipid phosphatase
VATVDQEVSAQLGLLGGVAHLQTIVAGRLVVAAAAAVCLLQMRKRQAAVLQVAHILALFCKQLAAQHK